MIKVLDKTFAILEKLALASPHPCRIGELAKQFGINTATCSRILKELVEAGYAIRVSRLEGYAAGPRAWTFASQVRYRERLIGIADPVIRRTASALEASVLLAERNGKERYILLHHNGCRKLDIVLGQLSFHDLFKTATGLLLTAFAPEKEQKELLESYEGKTSRLFPPRHRPHRRTCHHPAGGAVRVSQPRSGDHRLPDPAQPGGGRGARRFGGARGFHGAVPEPSDRRRRTGGPANFAISFHIKYNRVKTCQN